MMSGNAHDASGEAQPGHRCVQFESIYLFSTFDLELAEDAAVASGLALVALRRTAAWLLTKEA